MKRLIRLFRSHRKISHLLTTILTVTLLEYVPGVLLAQSSQAYYFVNQHDRKTGPGSFELDWSSLAEKSRNAWKSANVPGLTAESFDRTRTLSTDRIAVPMDDFPIDSTEFSVDIAPGMTQEFSMETFSSGGTVAAFGVVAGGDDGQFLEFTVTDAFPIIFAPPVTIWNIFFSVKVVEGAPARTLNVSFVIGAFDAGGNVLGGSAKAIVRIIAGSEERSLTVAEARSVATGTIVTVEGIVTRAKGRLTRIQDETAGIAIFQDNGLFFEAVTNQAILMGDRLRITGELSEFNSLKEIINPSSFEVLSTGNGLPQAQVLTLSEIAQNGEEFESELVAVEGLQIEPDGDVNFQQNKAYQIVDPMSQLGVINLFVGRESDSELVGQPIPTSRFSYVGVLGQFSPEEPEHGYQLTPVKADDITLASPPALNAEFGAEPKAGTAPLTVQFNDESIGSINDRLWSFGDGGISVATNPSYTYQQSGVYTVSLTVSNSDGSDTETKEDYILVEELAPPLNLTAALSGGNVMLSWDPPSYTGTETDTLLIAYDDGTAENALTTSTDDFELCVRFTPPDYPASLIGLAFVGGVATPDDYGIFVYLDPAGTNDGPSGQPVFEGEAPIRTVGANGGLFPTPINIQSGDFYISLVKLSKTNGFAVGLDTSSPDAERSWAKLETTTTPLAGSEFAGNLIINALVVESSTDNSLIAIDSGRQAHSQEFPPSAHRSIAEEILRENISNTIGFESRGGIDFGHFNGLTIESNFDHFSLVTEATLIGFKIYRSIASPVSTTPANRIAEVGPSVSTFIEALPPGDEVFYVVTAQYDAGESGPSNEVQVGGLQEESPMIEARAKSVGTIVTVRGIVTRTKGRLTRIQDGTGAITIFESAGSFFDALTNASVRQGDELKITGELSDFNSLLQLVNISSFQVISQDNPIPEPHLVTLTQIAQNGEEFESELIRVVDLQIDPDEGNEFLPAVTYQIWDSTDRSGAVTLRTPDAGDSDIDGQPIPSGPSTFVGVLGQFDSPGGSTGYQLQPIQADDILETEPAQPTLVSPENGEGDISVNPQLTWNASSGAKSYGLQLATLITFETTVVDTNGIAGTSYQVSDLEQDRQYFWRIQASNRVGTSDWSATSSFVTESNPTVSVEEASDAIPAEFGLNQNYPNPFNPETSIRYELPKTTTVELSVYNLSGQKIVTLDQGQKPAGSYSVHWDGRDHQGRDVASGVYFYRLQTREFIQVRKLTLLK